MNQIEFFDAIKTKQMKEVAITLACGCEVLYAPLTEEVFGRPCPLHPEAM